MPDPTPHTALFSEERSAEVVAASFAATPDPRLWRVLTSLVEHLHAFVKDIGLTEEEWARAIAFLTATGQKCDDVRQEFILLSDVLGVSMLVDAISHRTGGTATESTVLGPFHVVASPPRELGDNISLAATHRHPYRPAHIHFIVAAPGYRPVTTHLFPYDSPYLDSDAVFGVKESLIRQFPVIDDPARAAEAGLPSPNQAGGRGAA